MGWLSDTLKSAAGSIIGNIAGTAGQNLGNQLVPIQYPEPPEPDFTQEEILEQVTLGNDLDIRNQKEMFDYRINQGISSGMTPYEMFMGPAAGAGGGTTGSGQTLGNSAQQQNAVRQKAQADMAAQQRNIMAQGAIQLEQTRMQTDAQRDVAAIQAGTQTRGQDIQKEIADNVLSLNQRELEEIKIPQAAAQLGLTKQQLQSEINKTATSTPKFQKEMKQLSMGPANLLVELTMRDMGISLADDSFMKLSESQRKKFLDKLVALASTMYVETSGARSLVQNPTTERLTDSIADLVAKFFNTGRGIEQTNAPPNPAPGARVSEPILGRPGSYGGSKR